MPVTRWFEERKPDQHHRFSAQVQSILSFSSTLSTVTFYLFKNFASPAYCATDTWPGDKLDMDEWCKLVLWMVFKKAYMMGKLSAVPLAEDSKCSKEDLNVNNKKAVLCHPSGQRSMLHEATATFGSLLSFLYLFLFFTYVGVKRKHNETHTKKKPKHGPRTSLCTGSEEKNNDFTVPTTEGQVRTKDQRGLCCRSVASCLKQEDGKTLNNFV